MSVLDPDIERTLAAMAASGAPALHDLPPVEAREAMRAGAGALSGEPEPVARVEDRAVDGIPVRVFWPEDHDGALLAWFHGGGWVVGDLDTYEAVCCALANASGAAVVSVDYRLAPEHPFPAAVNDAMAATQWLLTHAVELGGDPQRVAVGGDSAGGNLATVAARHVTGVRFQCLVYPVCDAAPGTASYDEFATGFGLTAEGMARYAERYLPEGADPADPDVSPLRARDLRGLPPAFIATASHDLLRDEGEAYAARLAEAGVPVILRRYEGTVHGFLRWLAQAAIARRAVSEAGAAVREALSPTG